MTTTQQNDYPKTLTLTRSQLVRTTYSAELDYETFSKHKALKNKTEDEKKEMWRMLWDDYDTTCDTLDLDGRGEEDGHDDAEDVEVDDPMIRAEYNEVVRDIVETHESRKKETEQALAIQKANLLVELEVLENKTKFLKAQMAELEKA
jgi:hypothetical protein